MPCVIFCLPDNTEQKVETEAGLSLLEIARMENIDLEGACEGSLACSTCHVIIDKEWYDRLDPAIPDEEDMLDLAQGLTKTSRLGCQIILTDKLDGLKVRIPHQGRHLSSSLPFSSVSKEKS